MNSPFKFLDAYDSQDKEIFFGREEEIEQLYKLIFQTNLMLVYGQSGTGKTSLIQCGLANRFKPTDWFELFVRRKDNINSSLDREIRRHAQTPIDDKATVVEAIQSLYLDHLRPVYLIFDQFEELFILGSPDEQQTFIHTIATLLKSDVACKVVIVMREEYIAMLYEFEKAVPSLFNKRLRVEPMSLRNVEQVIIGTTAAFGIALEKNEVTAQQIIDNLSDHRAGVQLSYLQVYLDKLYRDAAKAQNGQSEAEPRIILTEELVRRTGALGDVMAEFLEEQTAAIQKDMKGRFPAIPADAVQRILEEFATLEGTKLPMSREEIAERLQVFNAIIDPCLMAFENSRFVRNAEGVYELAHDTLAGRIADKRSGERKNLLKVQKLIKDRYSAYEQTHTYLNNEELGFTHPYLTQLSLTADEANFVRKSADKVRRKRLGLIAVTTSIGLVLAGALLWALIERDRAKDAIARASNFTNQLSYMIYEQLKPIPGTADIRGELLKKVKAVDDELARGRNATQSTTPFWTAILRGDIALERENRDQARKEYTYAKDIAEWHVHNNAGDKDWKRYRSVSYLKLGDLEVAHDNLDAARFDFKESVKFSKELVDHDKSNNPDWLRDLSISYGKLGDLEFNTDDPEGARKPYTESLNIATELYDRDKHKKSREWQRDLAIGHRRVGYLESRANNHKAAGDSFRSYVNIVEDLARDNPNDVELQKELAYGYWLVGEAESSTYNWASAREASKKAIKIRYNSYKDPRDKGEWQHDLSKYHRQLGEIETEDKNWESAGVAIEQSVELAKGLDPKNLDWQHSLSLSYRALCHLKLKMHDLAVARAASDQALEVAQLLHEKHPDNPQWERDRLTLHEQRGEIEVKGKQIDAARRQYTKSLEIAQRLHDDTKAKELLKTLQGLQVQRRSPS